jgi:hypothetical protein
MKGALVFLFVVSVIGLIASVFIGTMTDIMSKDGAFGSVIVLGITSILLYITHEELEKK